MFVLGLTGGIGSGKSTVASMLERRGAVAIDADKVAREVVEPGTEGYREVVEAFGPGVVGPDGALDRAKLAEIVFADPDRRRQLNDIIHPRVGARIAERLGELGDFDGVVVLDVPLLVESTSGSRRLVQAILVVASSVHTQVRRAVERGMTEDDARARIAAQAPLEEKLAVADYVVWNDGTLEELEARVDEVWAKLRERVGA